MLVVGTVNLGDDGCAPSRRFLAVESKSQRNFTLKGNLVVKSLVVFENVVKAALNEGEGIAFSHRKDEEVGVILNVLILEDQLSINHESRIFTGTTFKWKFCFFLHCVIYSTTMII